MTKRREMSDTASGGRRPRRFRTGPMWRAPFSPSRRPGRCRPRPARHRWSGRSAHGRHRRAAGVRAVRGASGVLLGSAGDHAFPASASQGGRGSGRHAGAVPGPLRRLLLSAGPLGARILQRAAEQDGRVVLHPDHVHHGRLRRHHGTLPDRSGPHHGADDGRTAARRSRRLGAGQRGAGGAEPTTPESTVSQHFGAVTTEEPEAGP